MQNDSPPDGDIASLLTPRATEGIPKRTRWTVFSLAPNVDATAENICDSLLCAVGDEKRHISVARHGDAFWALLFKGDDKIVKVDVLPDVSAVYDIRKPTGGGATRNAMSNFGKDMLHDVRRTNVRRRACRGG